MDGYAFFLPPRQVIVQLLQVGLAEGEVTAGGDAFVQGYATGFAIVDEGVIGSDQTEGIGHGEEGKVGGRGVQEVFTKSELTVRNA